jgi:hypothetical protein
LTKSINTIHAKGLKRLQTINTEIIQDKLQKIIHLTIEDLINQEGYIHWDKIEIESCCIPSGLSIKTDFYTDDYTEKEIALVWGREEKDPVEILNEIKKEMYNQYPEEGAWIECKMTINSDETYHIDFNYDDFDKFSKRAKNPENLTREFEKYPRKKEFTPEWWQKILGRKAKYLK